MAPVTVPNANKTAAELDLAESRHLGSGHRDHCKPQSLLRATGTRAGGASDALAHSAHQKLLSPLCRGGEGGLWGQPPDQAAVQSLLPVCGCMAAVKQGSHSPPGGLQLVRQGDSSLFLCVSHGVVGGLGQG